MGFHLADTIWAKRAECGEPLKGHKRLSTLDFLAVLEFPVEGGWVLRSWRARVLPLLLRRLRGQPHQSANQHIRGHLPHRKEMVCLCEATKIFKSVLQRAYGAVSLGQVQYIQRKRKLMTQRSSSEIPETQYPSLVVQNFHLEE